MTNQIYLRPWLKEDAAHLAQIANNKKIWLNVRDAFPFPYTVGNALQWIAFTKEQRPIQHMAIIYNNMIVGSIGITTREDVYRNTIEIGYFIGEDFWGKGLATRAVALLLEYIPRHFNVVRIFAEVFEHNIASMRVLEKNGFHLESVRKQSVCKNHVIMNDHVWVKLVD